MQVAELDEGSWSALVNLPPADQLTVIDEVHEKMKAGGLRNVNALFTVSAQQRVTQSIHHDVSASGWVDHRPGNLLKLLPDTQSVTGRFAFHCGKFHSRQPNGKAVCHSGWQLCHYRDVWQRKLSGC